jgi:hypothetical protein
MKYANFKQSTADPCIFMKSEGDDLSVVAIYVDDLVIITKAEESMKRIKETLSARFQMKDLGKIHHCLGITIIYDEDNHCLWMHQIAISPH